MTRCTSVLGKATRVLLPVVLIATFLPVAGTATSSQPPMLNVSAAGIDLYPTVVPSGPAPVGGLAIFSVVAHNAGGVSATGPTTLTLSLSGAVGGSPLAVGDGWSCDAPSSTCTTTAVVAASGELPPVHVTVPVHEVLVNATTLTLTARVSTPGEGSAANDTASSQTPLVAASGADLALSVSARGPAIAGANGGFRVLMTNVGGASAPGPVRVSLTPTGGIRSSSVTEVGTGWSCPGDGHECTSNGPIPAGTTLPELVVEVPTSADYITAGAAGLNVALVGNHDGLPANDSASATAAVSRSSSADLAVAVSPQGPAPVAGLGLFRVAVRNLGGATAPGPVRVALSTSGSISSSALTETGSAWSCPGDGSECTSTGSVASGASLPDLVVKVPVTGDASQGTHVSLHASIVNPIEDVHSNDSASATSPVVRNSGDDLALAVSPAGPAVAGESGGFTVSTRNLGGGSVTGPVRVGLSASGPLRSSSLVGSGTGWTCPGDGRECTHIGNVAAGDALPDLTVTLAVGDDPASPGQVGLYAQLTAPTGGQTLNDSGSATSPVTSSTLAVDLNAVLSPVAPAVAGSSVTSVVHISNYGTQASSGRTTVQLSNNYAEGRASGSGWSCSTSLQCDNADPVAAGATLPDLTLTIDLPTPGTPAAASINASVANGSDVNHRNDITALAFGVGGAPADLSVDLGGPGPGAGSFVAHVRNTGTTASTGPVTLNLSSPVAGGRASGNGWTCTSQLACGFSSAVDAGATLPDLAITFPLPPADGVATYSVSASVTGGPESTDRNNTSDASTSSGIPPVDLQVALSTAAAVHGGDDLQATAVVRNTGTGVGTAPVTLQVSSPFPGAVVSGAGWTCSSELLCIHPGPIDAQGSLPTLTVTAPTPLLDNVTSASFYAQVISDDDGLSRNNSVIATTSTGGVPIDLSILLLAGDPIRAGAFSHTTARVNNTGTSTTTGPISVRFSSPYDGAHASGDGWTCDSQLACEHPGPVVAGGVLPDLDLVLRAPLGTAATTVGLYGNVSGGEESNTRNDDSSITLPVVNRSGPAALTTDVERVGSSGPVVSGDLLNLPVTVVNRSAYDVGTPTVMLSPSFGLSIHQAGGTGWSCTALTCTYVSTLAPGDSAQLSVQVMASPTTATRSFLTATTSWASPAAGRDSQTLALVLAGRGVDLAPVVTSGPAATAGGVATFRVGVRNVGGDTASRPTEVQLTTSGAVAGRVIAHGSGWSCPAGANRCTTTAPAQAQRSLPDLMVDVPVPAEASASTVNLTAVTQNDLDTASADDSSYASNAIVATTVADLALSATPIGKAPAAGNALFDVTVRNLGGGTRVGPVRISLSPRSSFRNYSVSGSGTGWSCVRDARECVYDGDVVAGDTLPNLRVVVPVSADYAGSSVIGIDARIVGPADSVSANDEVQTLAPVTSPSGVDLGVSVSGQGLAPAGGTSTFSVAVRNLGGGSATGPVRISLSPSGSIRSYTLSTSGSGWTCPGDARECLYDGNVASGALLPSLQVGVPVADDLASSGSVNLSAALLSPDLLSGNDNGNASAPVVASTSRDLAVALSPVASAPAGGLGDFRLVVRNLGGAAVPAPVRVTLSPFGGILTSSLTGSGLGWSCPGDGRECIQSSGIAAGGTAPTLVIHIPVAAESPGVGYIGLGASVHGTAEDVHGNNDASASSPITGSVHAVDLSIITAASAPVPVGGRLTFTSVVSNTGTADSNGTVTVNLGSPGSGSTAAGAGWACDPDLSCTRSGGVQAGGSLPSLVVTTDLPNTDFYSGLSSSSSVQSPDDEVTGNNWSSAATSAGGVPVDLTVDLDAPTPVRQGETAVWAAHLVNSGTSPSSGPATVQLSAPSGSTASGDAWVCSTQLVCTYSAPLAAGGAAPDLVLRAPTPGADAVGIQQISAYLTEGASEALTRNDNTYATSAIGGVPVDVSVRLSAPKPTTQGSQLQYAAVVSNTGTSATSGAVTVHLSSPFSGASASGVGWACSSHLVCEQPGPIPAGGDLPDLVLLAPVPVADSAVAAPADASVEGGADALTRNNYASAGSSTGGTPADLVVQLTGETPLVAGSVANLTAKVKNVGSEAAADTVTIQISAPFTATATGDQWFCSSTLQCDHAGPVAPGQVLPDLVVSMSIPTDAQPGTGGISASITSRADRNTRNNTDYVVLPIVRLLGAGAVGSAYLSVQPATAGTYPGGVQELLIQLNGAAPLADQIATLSVTLPAGVAYVSDSSAGLPEPSGSPDAPVWTVTMPSDGQTLNARFSVKVAAATDAGSQSVRAALVGPADITENVSSSFGVVRPTLSTVAPTSVGRAPSVSVSFSGIQLDPSFTYSLVNGATTLPAVGVHGAGGNVVGTIDSSSAASGTYDAVVGLPDGSMLILANGVSVLDASKDDISVSLVGPGRVRLNAPGRYYATVTNAGNVDAYDVPVVLTVPSGVDATVVAPESKAILAAAVDSITASVPAADQLSPEVAEDIKNFIASSTTQAMPDPVKPVSYVMTYVPHLPAGTSSTSTFEVTPRQRITADITASVPVDTQYFGSTQHVSNIDRRVTLPATGKITNLDEGVASICNDPSLADACPTVRGYVTGLQKAQETARDYGCVSFAPLTLGFYNTDCSFNNPLSLKSVPEVIERIILKKFPLLKPYKDAFDTVHGVYKFAKGLLDKLLGAADQIELAYKGVELGVVATDPNELDGPQGYGTKHFLQPGAPLEYTIKFENVKAASAAAQRVTVVDHLPPTVDPSTVQVLSAEIGGVVIPLVDSSTEEAFATSGSTTLEPGRDVLFDASVDRTTGLMSAHFAGPSALDDPFTPSPYSDFLPPNVTPGEGEGSLRLIAQTKSGLPDATVITNEASITFDDHLGGPTIATNSWSNTIDATPPTTVLTPLPPRVDGAAKLTWTTTDTGSGGTGVRLYQGVDGGPLELSNLYIGGPSVTVPLGNGHTYAFAVEPVDGASNVGPRSSVVSTSAVANTRPSVSAFLAGTSSLTAPSKVTFSEDVIGISATSVALTRAGVRVPTVLACTSVTGLTTTCTGRVRAVRLTPASLLEPGAAYRVNVTSAVTDVDSAALPAYASPVFRAALLVQDLYMTSVWATVTDAKAVAGHYSRERAAGAQFTTTFGGTGVKLWYVAGPDQGRVKVMVDGVVRDSAFDQYAATRTYRKTRSYTGLKSGTHTLVVTVLGTRRAASNGTYVVVDAISTTTATCTTTTDCVGDPSATFALARVASTVASDARVRLSDTAGSRLRERFTGTGFDLYLARGPRMGLAQVLVDGKLVATINGYAATASLLRFTKTGLAAGSHTVEVVVTGKTGKTGVVAVAVAVDRLVVR